VSETRGWQRNRERWVRLLERSTGEGDEAWKGRIERAGPKSDLIDAQYADRPELRPIYDAILDAAKQLGDVVVQARKTCVSLVSPRRTFARVQPTTRQRVDLGLRTDGSGQP
jgi:hypothetical protein